jgi:ribosome-binding factor A
MDPIVRARLNSQLRALLAELLLRQVKDPRVEGVTVTGVEVTQDLAWARVYFSLLGDPEARRVAQRGLESVAGFLRHEIGHRMHLRMAPQLRFAFDPSLERGQRMETLLRQLHEEAVEPPPVDGPGAKEEPE